MSYDPQTPNDNLPLLMPAADKWESMEVYRELADTRAALGELKGRISSIPDPMLLINTLVLHEAKDSSTIENIFTTNDKLYHAFAASGTNIDPAAKEVLNYRAAIITSFSALQRQKKITPELVIGIASTIKDGIIGFRTDQVWIGNDRRTVYVPPSPGEVLKKKLKNWFESISDATIDPLIKVAILHYQFEAIHPFVDGNGRTGRLLNILLLVHEKLLDLPILYLSKYILEYKREYYGLLQAVNEQGDWEAWILYMLRAVKSTAIDTLHKVEAIHNSFNGAIEKVRTEAPEVYSHELINLLYRQPYCRIQFLEQEGIASRNTASKYLKKLVDIGVLRLEQTGKENTYINIGLYDILAH